MNHKVRNISKIEVIAIILAVFVVTFAGCSPKATVKQDQEATGETTEPALITEIVTIEDSESAVVLVKGNRLLTFTSVKQPHPPGVILYFPETALSDIGSPIIPESDLIASIKASQLTENGNTSRVEISLQTDTSYEVTREDADLKVTFKKASEMLSSTQTAEATKEDTATSQPADSTPVEGSESAATRLHSVYAKKLDKGVEIHVRADGPIKDYKYFTIDNPARIVFDLLNIQSDYTREHLVSVNTEWVKSVRHFGYPDRLRIVLDTTQPYLSAYSSSTVESGLVIRVGAQEGSKEMAAGQASTAEATSEKPAWVNRIDFSSGDLGKSTIIVGTTRPVEYQLKKADEKRIQLQLLNTRLPVYRQRPLITTRFESAVDRVIPVQTEAMKGTTQISIEMREAVPYRVEQTEDLLFIHFEASTVPPKPLEEAGLPQWKQVFTQTVAETVGSGAGEIGEARAEAAVAGTGDTTYTMEKSAERFDLDRQTTVDTYTGEEKALDLFRGSEVVKQYTGEKIALDFFETDIKNVFRILREISGENFAIDKDVTGKVSLTFEKPVPWDQVLDLVLKMNQLGKKYEGNIIRIATLKTLADEEKERKEKLESSQMSKRQEDHVTVFIPISYAVAKDIAEQHITPLLTMNVGEDQKGKLSVDERLNTIILTDVPLVIKQAREIVQKLDKVTPQVMIEARIVEATSTVQKELGIQWGGGYGNQSTNVLNNVSNAYGTSTETDMNALVGSPEAGEMPYGFNSAVNLGNLGAAAPSIGFNFIRIAGTPLLLNAKLLALEVQGELKIVSAPKIVTLDNKTATIKQGLEYPYNKLDKDGNVTTELIPIFLELSATPHVTPDNRISMSLVITKRDLGSIINAQQSFTTKEAETELLVDDGDTVVIGGIIKTTENVGEVGVPFLSKLPILGWLFKSRSNSSAKEELLIFLTPKIVQLEQHTG